MQFQIRLLQSPAALLAAAVLALGIGISRAGAAPTTAKPSVPSVVTLRKQRAARHAAGGKYALALDEISKARERVRDAISTSSAGYRRPPPNPALIREAKALHKWYSEKVKKSPQGRKDAALATEYKRKMAALRKKYPDPGRSPGVLAQQNEQRRKIALLNLTMADLEELSANYHSRNKDADQAAIYRIQALTTRLDAERTLGNAPGAMKAADALLRLDAPDPGVYNRIGSYYQGAGQFQKAADVWARGIKLLETGSARLRTATGSAMSAQNRNQVLGQFYRQLAFCYSKTGRKVESQNLIRKAAAAEAMARRP